MTMTTKNVELPTTAEALVAEREAADPAASDPRRAPAGTPIAFPDPEADYPTSGDPYPPPTPPVAGV
jgi:hypothetical protein